MKKVYILNQNHMDVLWRRCFEEYFYEKGNVIRPYVDIEEALFDSWIEIINSSDCKYSIEQTSTIKKYLERNPDKIELFRRFVQEGKIEILGGGETIVDSNIPCGESIVRNHLYSILWCMEQFGVRPQVNTSCDIFGLSAQLPQIMRKLGYMVIANYSRVFENAKPYWKGLNGDIVLIAPFTGKAMECVSLGEYFKYPPCSDCLGEGCLLCNYSGMDYTHKANMPTRFGFEAYDSNSVFILEGQDIGSLEGMFENISKMSCDEVILNIGSEEIVPDSMYAQRIDNCRKQLGLTVEYITLYELYEKLAKEYLVKLAAGNIPTEEIDERAEGNPVGTGCFVTRIKLKQYNRELEDMLLSCEKFSVFAADLGMIYPRKKIERLWNQMAILHFHDGITATHKDGCYEELLKYIRNIRLGASKIYSDAMKTIANHVNVHEKIGFKPILIFNPLNWEVRDVPVDIAITFPKTEDIRDIELKDLSGNPLDVLKLSITEKDSCKTAKVTLKCPAVPSLGYTTIYSRKTDASIAEELKTVDFIENKFYKISIGRNGLEYIYDKDIHQNILVSGANGLTLETDFGGPWETIMEPGSFEPLFNRSNPVTSIIARETSQTIIFEAQHGMKWRQEITLYRGIKKIYFKTAVEWELNDSRLRIAFPLSFRTPNDEAYYEIPYGILKREKYKGTFSKHMDANGDWPAIHFVSCRNDAEDYTVTLMNRGTGSHKLENGVLYMSVLRSPTLVTGLNKYDATDKGSHIFEYCLTSNKGSVRDGSVVQQGMEYNTWFQSMEVHPSIGILQSAHSFLPGISDNVVVSTVKNAEYGSGKVIRIYEAYGEEIITSLPESGRKKYVETDLLEENMHSIDKLVFKPYEIKTIKG